MEKWVTCLVNLLINLLAMIPLLVLIISGGSVHPWNTFPQNPNFNSVVWNKFEADLRGRLQKNFHKVSVWYLFTPFYLAKGRCTFNTFQSIMLTYLQILHAVVKYWPVYVCFHVWTHPSFLLREVAAFAPLKLPALWWGTYLLNEKLFTWSSYKVLTELCLYMQYLFQKQTSLFF